VTGAAINAQANTTSDPSKFVSFLPRYEHLGVSEADPKTVFVT
jgi:hypothetical protein